MRLLEWLHDDGYFKSCRGNGPLGKLAKSLGDLEVHLVMWKAKYEVWIPHQPAHSLVFLNDEKKHGAGFPTAIDALVKSILVRQGNRS